MNKAVITLLVGLMLSLGGGANALTFGSDGKEVKDSAVPDSRTPAQLLATMNSDGRVLKLYNPQSTKNTRYDFSWSACSLISHNTAVILKHCSQSGDIRKLVLKEAKEKKLRAFRCGAEGYERYVKNFNIVVAGANSWVTATCEPQVIKWTINQYKRLTSIIDNAPSTETSVVEVASTSAATSILSDEFQAITLSCNINPWSINHWEVGKYPMDRIGSVFQQHQILPGNKIKSAELDAIGTIVSENDSQIKFKYKMYGNGPVTMVFYVSKKTGKLNLITSLNKTHTTNGHCEFSVTEPKKVDKLQVASNLNETTGTIVKNDKHLSGEMKKQKSPTITIAKARTEGRMGFVQGVVKSQNQLTEVLINGLAIKINLEGVFEWSGFVPATGKEITIEAIDNASLSSRQVVKLERGQIRKSGILRFDELNPMSGKIAQANQNALALIVGISEYNRTNAPAIFADNDAQFFQDYAALKLGIPENNITTLLNADAGQVDVLLSVKNWLARAVRQKQSDVYVFFAGHGLASDDGEEMFLLPYDGAPELLEETTIARQKLFREIAAANPRSVTVFLDTCYSGTTRGPDMLIASRPIAIRAKEQAVPEGFTVMTAAAGDQTAKPLEEAKHGMFSYFLMKGMEGDADANQDNLITAGELQEYVYQNVVQQSSGSQTPELKGDADRVLVRFQ